MNKVLGTAKLPLLSRQPKGKKKMSIIKIIKSRKVLIHVYIYCDTTESTRISATKDS